MSDDATETTPPSLLDASGRRPPSRKGSDYVTRKEMETFVTNHAETLVLPNVKQMIEWYMRQIPGLNAQMIGDAFAANGLEFKPPLPAEQLPDQPSTPS